ncbi:nitrate reductase associated protein [Lyngbya confervoides]|uniref:Nitrate reductase associated protein n=1 Tax=Lyngbya confervoides BDU141951 TaxID=1574623 RepID=A0ABD4T1K9_9CYAN|nr:nitrate reductase associated protein [Lyngbya confervoides]MCM1982286.1 nitrate reductase associated protein [Lyngbya confervoides BDU141951]
MSDSTYFQFEEDFVASLRCIPMAVRYKLDTCGIKLKLDQWHHFTRQERQALVDRPCQDATEAADYRQFLTTLIQARSQSQAKTLPVEANPPWLNEAQIPESLQQKARREGAHLDIHQWQVLTPLQRFALIKLSQPSHESHNFIPALQEFGLLEAKLP